MGCLGEQFGQLGFSENSLFKTSALGAGERGLVLFF